jgi:Zn-finger nucleic acid-binding protein
MTLQACTSCERQYDVSHLSPGDRVRCVCDELLTVKDPKTLTVRARKCSNCGGRVEPEGEKCSYCASELLEPDLASTLCPGCFRRIEDDSNHCKACGIAIAPQGLTALPDGSVCPRCKGELRIRSLGPASVVECAGCEGLWVKRDEFDAICKRAQERPEVALEMRATDLQVRSAEPERKVFYIPCPTCGETMQRKMFRYKNLASRVVIDFCREHGVWFDKDELEGIVAFIRSRGDAEVPYDPDVARRRRRPGTTAPYLAAGIGSRSSDLDVLGSFLVLDGLGHVLGGLIESLFD